MSVSLHNVRPGNRRRLTKRPYSRELRTYLLDLVREERSLEGLYRASHNLEELRQVRAEWKSSYRSIRDAMIVQELRVEQPQRPAPADEATESGDRIMLSPRIP